MMSWYEFRARPGPRARGLHPLRVDDALTEEDLTDHSHGRNCKRSGWADKGHCAQVNSPRTVRYDRWHAHRSDERRKELPSAVLAIEPQPMAGRCLITNIKPTA